MLNVLRITVRFLNPEPAFHGKRDGGESEWPPSPLRLFQALVDAAANGWRKPQFVAYAKPALEWLQDLRPSEIVAPPHHVGTPFRIAVPNNDLDVWAGPVSKGSEPKKQPNELKTMKTVQPTRIRIGTGERGDAIHYLYGLPTDGLPHLEVLKATARSVTHVGWGIDMATAYAEVITEADAAKLPGHRWRVVPAGGVPLRVPKAGTLDDLLRKHAAFLGRLSSEGFKPVPPLSCFDVVGYYSPTAVLPIPSRPIAAFEIWKPLQELAELPAGKSRFRPFDAVRRFAHVAGMVRHAAANAALQAGWDEGRVKSFILGHGDGAGGQATTDDRLMFVPLPSITPLKVESIRRVLVVGPPGTDISRIRQLLSGAELMEEGRPDPVAMLSFIPQSDRNVSHYTRSARVWSTVTPVVLPGFDDPDGLRKKLNERRNAEVQKKRLDRLDRRTLDLLKKAFKQAGCPNELVEDAELEYREVGFRAGVDLAMRYELPPLKFPRYHVRVRFRHRIQGPLAVGAGRYRGLGVFAAEGAE